jgi:nicotinamidase-related amidase
LQDGAASFQRDCRIKSGSHHLDNKLETPVMSDPKTLLELSGADLSPAALDQSVLLLIDMQNEYLEGPLALPDAAAAVARTQKLLAAARTAGSPVIHVAHKGKSGSLFDRDAHRGQIADALAPIAGEAVIEKGLPNSFTGTNLHDTLQATGRSNLVVAGFMTHMCVSSTARSALDHGYRVTVDADCCATRDLPDGKGGKVDARLLHDISLVELSDRFAVIARDHDWS